MSIATIIGNPTAGRGGASEGWEALGSELTRAGFEVRSHLTSHPGHATELATRARDDRAALVVAVGGDGTVHEVVNGLLAGGAVSAMPELGVVALGSGCDYVRSFEIAPGWTGAAERLTSDRPARAVDAGEVTYSTEGGLQSRFFCNIAEVGIGPEVVRRATALPRALRGAVYFFGFWLTLPRFQRRQADVEMDAERYDGELTNLVVAIGSVFGGGMRIAPDADPTDGAFDVQVHFGTKLDYVRGIPKVYRGTHLPHPKILQAAAEVVEVSCDPPGLIEADGEILGTTPATFRIHRGALKLKV